MSTPSHAAQAVLTKIDGIDDPRWIAAAAIRAAACLEAPSNFDGTLYETGEDEFRAFLHSIAAELETGK